MNINYGKGQEHVIRRFRKYTKLRHHGYLIIHDISLLQLQVGKK